MFLRVVSGEEVASPFQLICFLINLITNFGHNRTVASRFHLPADSLQGPFRKGHKTPETKQIFWLGIAFLSQYPDLCTKMAMYLRVMLVDFKSLVKEKLFKFF